MKRERVYIEHRTGDNFNVLSESKEVLFTGTLPECQSFVTDYEKGQASKDHKLTASVYFWISTFMFTAALIAGFMKWEIEGQMACYASSIIFMILSEGHNAKC